MFESMKASGKKKPKPASRKISLHQPVGWDDVPTRGGDSVGVGNSPSPAIGENAGSRPSGAVNFEAEVVNLIFSTSVGKWYIKKKADLRHVLNRGIAWGSGRIPPPSRPEVRLPNEKVLPNKDVILVLTSWGWLQFGPGNQFEDKVFTKKEIVNSNIGGKGKKDVNKPAEQSRLQQRDETLQLSTVHRSISHWWSGHSSSLGQGQISSLYLVLGEIGGIIVMPENGNFVSRGNWIRTNYRIPRALSCRLASYFSGSYVYVRKKVLDDFYSKLNPGFEKFISDKIAGVFPLDILLWHHKDVRELYGNKDLVGILNLEARRTRISFIEHGKTECLSFDVPWGVVDIFEDSDFSTSSEVPEETVKSLLPVDQDELLRLMHSYSVPHLAMQKFFSNLLGALRLILGRCTPQEGKVFPENCKIFLAGGFALYTEKTTARNDLKLLSALGERVVQELGFKAQKLSFIDSGFGRLSLTRNDMQKVGGIYFSKPGLREVSSKGGEEAIETYYSDNDLYYAGKSPANHALSKYAASSRESISSPLPYSEESSTVSDAEKSTMSIGIKVFVGIFAIVLIVGFYFLREHYNSLYENINARYIQDVKKNKIQANKLNEYRDYYRSSSSSRLLRLSKNMDERIKLKRFHVTRLESGKYKMILEGVFFNELQGDGTKPRKEETLEESPVDQRQGAGTGTKMVGTPVKTLGVKARSDHFKEYLGHLFKATIFVSYKIDELKIVEQDRQESDGYGFIVTIIENIKKTKIDL